MVNQQTWKAVGVWVKLYKTRSLITKDWLIPLLQAPMVKIQPPVCLFFNHNDTSKPSSARRSLSRKSALFVKTFFCPLISSSRWESMAIRVSTETSFISKQPKLEPKLVSALSETRRLFQMFRFNIKTGSFGVLKQPKQTKDQLKQQQIC